MSPCVLLFYMMYIEFNNNIYYNILEKVYFIFVLKGETYYGTY